MTVNDNFALFKEWVSVKQLYNFFSESAGATSLVWLELDSVPDSLLRHMER
jgi:hypothetical protein